MEDCAHANKENIYKNIQYLFMSFQTGMFRVAMAQTNHDKMQTPNEAYAPEINIYGFLFTIPICLMFLELKTRNSQVHFSCQQYINSSHNDLLWRK